MLDFESIRIMPGSFHTEKDVLILEPAKGGYKTQQNCGGSGNQEKPGDLSRKELRFHFEMSDGKFPDAGNDGSCRNEQTGLFPVRRSR